MDMKHERHDRTRCNAASVGVDHDPSMTIGMADNDIHNVNVDCALIESTGLSSTSHAHPCRLEELLVGDNLHETIC